MLVPEKSNADQIRVEVEADLAGIPFREPVIDNKTVYDIVPGEDFSALRSRVSADEAAREEQHARIERQWVVLTELARRAIIALPDESKWLADIMATPLSEDLPRKTVAKLAETDPRIAGFAEVTRNTLGYVLGLDSVPDELFEPDLYNSPALYRREDVVNALTYFKNENLPDAYRDFLQGAQKQVECSPGVTPAERDLAARRYRYARDIKLLNLMAELKEQPVVDREAKDGTVTYELRSGTKLVMTSEALEANPMLLDPRKWESRHQLKDRVYIVVVDGKECIMKERKTPRHTDTKKHGHIDGLTSQQEFEVAKEFSDLGTIRQGDIELRWEKPLGYVEFPDGYQFCLFESEPGLETDAPQYQLADEIVDSAEEYAEEFAQVKQRAREIYNERKDLLWRHRDSDVIAGSRWQAFSTVFRRQKKAREDQPKPDDLMLNEFAQLKADRIIDEARDLLSQTMRDHGYTNSDLDGYAFRLHKGKRPIVEIIGFDFEYYSKDPEGAERITRDIQEGSGGRNLQAYLSTATRAIVLAASYGMDEQTGKRLPPREDS